MKIAVLGNGAWGTALAISQARQHTVTLWGRNTLQLDAMASERVNRQYLPGFRLPDGLLVRSSLAQAVSGADLIIVMTSIAGLRPTLQQLVVDGVRPAPLLWACKGFEAGSAMLPHRVVAEALSSEWSTGVLSGPSFAKEVAAGLPTALTLASFDLAFARDCAAILHSARLRVYASDDVIGVEVGAAAKNVMAIAAGICDGLELGLNARAAMMTRGLAEITRLGMKLGGQVETFMGLAGVGDLILTCTGDLSRNRRVGLMLAQGNSTPDILRELGHVAEGVASAREVQRLALENGVDMPITDAVCRALFDHAPITKIVESLLERVPSVEFKG